MSLSIVIVNYKTAQLVIDCIRSIYKFDTSGIEIIVVDNNSNDNIQTLLTLHFPSIVLIKMNYNAGFARANNAGIKKASGNTVLLLNSDTIILDNAVDNAFHKLAISEYVACGVQLLNIDGSPQISGNYIMKGGLNYLLPLPYMGVAIKKLGELLSIKKPNVPNATDTVEVDWINGAFLMVKKVAIDKAGYLDEDFFLYAEEAEWCSRIKKVGKLCIYGSEKVLHLQGVSANDAFKSEGQGYTNLFDKKGLQIMLSNFLRIRKQFGIAWFLFMYLMYVVAVPVFFIFGWVSILFSGRPKYTAKDISGYIQNIFSMIEYLPKIISNRPFFYKVI